VLRCDVSSVASDQSDVDLDRSNFKGWIQYLRNTATWSRQRLDTSILQRCMVFLAQDVATRCKGPCARDGDISSEAPSDQMRVVGV
jgi:hypothetical protein